MFAGLWDAWKKPDGQSLRSYTIVTTEPNEMLAPVHNRMPVMLNDSNALDWLKGGEIEHALVDCAPPAGECSPRFEGSEIGGFGLLNCHLVFLRG